ncbi:MAG TPA: T9SS type A sorting domain-containing protein [Bacteroidales bacterium]|nr:T9SS type A sorting domain-containing protein [Bacteroidales bacterium]
MKRLILLLIIAAVSLVDARSQSLALIYNNERINNGTVVLLTGELNSDPFYEIVAHARVLNLTNRSVDVRARRIIIDTVTGTENYLCWVQCFPPDVDVSQQVHTIGAFDTTANDVFGGHYVPKSRTGKSIIKYEFWVDGSPEDKAFFTVEFFVQPSSIFENNNRLGNAAPNPARESVRIDYQLHPSAVKASIRISNLMGQTVLEQPLNTISGTIQLPLTGLQEGIYFYSLVIDSQVSSTRKLVVRR